MPTLPVNRSPRSVPTSHDDRRTAESFGSRAERYDRARPHYPQALVDRIIASSPRPSPDVLDVGCGTGIVARQFEAAGARVLGVDADVRMAGLARQRGLEVEVARFEEWETARRTFDVVVSGQAWHWIDPAAGAAKAAQALRPDGLLALFWNAGQPQSDIAEAFAEIYHRLLPGSLAARQWETPAVEGYASLCAKAAHGIQETRAFADPERWRLDWNRTYTRDEWLDQLPTQGALTRLPRAELEEVLGDVGTAIDAVGGGFTMHYATLATTAARAAAD
ncbi:class I SAM-dependent methyltransferase [Streptomyces sp. NPDC059165]|uniref:class I SAM-dependent methyltransferase n=1 Tax=Streptomyces sp. NPDC059165 TaxID=3346751 RepID=UPI0036B2C977